MAKERAKAAFRAAREARGKKRPAEDVEAVAPELSKDETAEVEADAESSEEDGEVEEPDKKKEKAHGHERTRTTKKGGARNKKQKKDKK